MSTSAQMEPVKEIINGGVGRCSCPFWFAVAHNILGVSILMVGVFGGLAIHDLFIYAGAIIIFLSLIWWVFWYSGNIDIPPEELEDEVGGVKLKDRGLSKVERQVSNYLSSSIRNSFRKNRLTSERPSSSVQQQNADLALCTIYNESIVSSSKENVRETLFL